MSARERTEMDRLLGDVMAAEREWGWAARHRGESQAGKLCLAALARVEDAIRRAQAGIGDYSHRLLTELRNCLAIWEVQERDEDGYGSSAIHRVIRAVEDKAASEIDRHPKDDA